MLVLGLAIVFLFTGVVGFLVFFFGSRLTNRQLELKEAIICAVIQGAATLLSSFLGIFGILAILFLMSTILSKTYDCDLFPSILMPLCIIVFPIALHLLQRAS